MSVYFLDTSALIKRYVIEPGTNQIQNMVVPGGGHQVIIAQITPVEIVSGVSRLKREGVITPQDAQKVCQLVNRHVRREYQVVRFTNQLVMKAQHLLENYPLRAYDAVQLASALDSNTRLLNANLPPLIFVSADLRLLNAAAAEGLQTYNPI